MKRSGGDAAGTCAADIIKSAGDPVFGVVSSTINGMVAGPTTGTDDTIHAYIT